MFGFRKDGGLPRVRYLNLYSLRLTVLFYMVRLERVSVVHKRLRSVPDIPRKETLNVVCLLLYTLSNISDTLHVHICQLLVIVP